MRQLELPQNSNEMTACATTVAHPAGPRLSERGLARVAGGNAFARAREMAAKDFTELDAWQLCKELQREILALLERAQFANNHRFRLQLDDAAASGPRNIAEGFTRYQAAEFAHFLKVALGSLGETRNHLIDACDRGYITPEERTKCDRLARRAIGATTALRSYLLSPRNTKSRQRTYKDKRNP